MSLRICTAFTTRVTVNKDMNISIVLKKQDPETFWRYWDECTAAVKAGPRYLRTAIEYGFAYAEGRNWSVGDESFAFIRDGKLLAVALLPIEDIGSGPQISWCGDHVPAPLFADRTVMKDVFRLIDECAERCGANKIMFHADALSHEPYNYLQKFGYLDSSILSYAVDLSGDGSLLNACRHGHKYDINRFSRDPDVELFCVDRVSPDARERHEEYRELHRKCAGKVTRSIETFDKQFDMLKSGNAVLCGVRYKGANVGYSYFTFANGSAWYYSGADDPDFSGLPLYHSMVYTAMQYLRQAGVTRIDMDQPASPSAQFMYYPDGKQLNIAKFKRGFGGDFLPFHRGVKYRSRESFIADQERFAQHHALVVENGLDNTKIST